MKLSYVVPRHLVSLDLSGKNKAEVLDVMTRLLAKGLNGVDVGFLGRILAERERLASTGIGDGVAIPHGKMPDIDRVVAAVGVAREGVDFEALDGKPVHILVAVIAPENATVEHLKVLARFSRLLRDAQFRHRLIDAADANEAHRILVEEDERHP